MHPEVVFLSACHVGPRGIGAVTLADLLLRQGAWAVLSTQIPVDVRRNAMVMNRLFANVHASARGELPSRSLLEIWHHTSSGNAVNDILSSSAALQAWSIRPTPRMRSVIEDFMLCRSPGRLRATHIYEDTEMLLGEIADETGFGDRYRSIVSSQGYAPETLLYQFVGWPERVVIRSDALADLTMREDDRSDSISGSDDSRREGGADPS